MPELKDLSGIQFGVWMMCLAMAAWLFNLLAETWSRLNGRDKVVPDPLHTQEVRPFATESDVRRVEARVQHLEEAQSKILDQLTRDKSEIMEAASTGRRHINEQIAQLAATCNRTAGSVQELSSQLATLFKSALRTKE